MRTVTIKSVLRSLARTGILQVPQIRSLAMERDRLREEVARLRDAASTKSQATPQTFMFAPPGHFYSPIPSLEDVRKREGQLFGNPSRDILAIDLNEKAQLALLERFKPFYDEQPFNASFEIVFVNTFLEHFYRERFAREIPLRLKNPGGGILATARSFGAVADGPCEYG